MDEPTPLPDPELLIQATMFVIYVNAVSISLLQRRFGLGYGAALKLVGLLEASGVITPCGCDGRRGLTSFSLLLRQDRNFPSARELWEARAIDPFIGGLGGKPGNPDARAIWLFGTEPGDRVSLAHVRDMDHPDHLRCVKTQPSLNGHWEFLQLLAAIHGEILGGREQFAHRHQPWLNGTESVFYGFLYPYRCGDRDPWTRRDIEETGFQQAEDLREWCNLIRLPAIAAAACHHRPRLFIGIGTSMVKEFTLAYFGAVLSLEAYQFKVGDYVKKILYAKHNGAVFVVLPDLRSDALGLNTGESRRIAGSFIAALLR